MEKTKLNCFLIVLFFLLTINLFAQPPGGPDGTGSMSVPSVNVGEKNINQLFIAPEVAQLLKVNFIPVNLYTGKLNLQIPLYEIKTGDISVPISLKYNSDGIKVEEDISNVGAGWVLEAGGSISKMVKDMDDRVVYGRLFPNGTTNGFIGKVVSIGNIVDASNLNTYYPSKDLMPDLFFATAPGLNSKFYFDRENNNIVVKEVNNSNNKISWGDPYNKIYDGDLQSLAWVGLDNIFFNLTASQKSEVQSRVNSIFQIGNLFSDYASFNISNTKGVSYQFSTSDVNVSYPRSSADDVYYAGIYNPEKFFTSVRNFLLEKYNISKGTWHLDEIIDTSNKKVTFEYNTYTSSSIKKYPNYRISGTATVSNEGGTQYEFNGLLNNPEHPDPELDKSFFSMNALYHYVKKIKWDGGEVSFLYDTDREDDFGKKALSRIIVKDNNQNTVREYLFDYGYLSTANSKRLKLNRVYVMEGNKQKVFYDLAYYEENSLPSKTSFKKDFLGYFNNNSVVDDQSYDTYAPKLYFVRDRKNFSITPFNVSGSTPISGGLVNLEANDYAATGLLKSMRSRTGGYNEFIYERNTFRFYGQDILGGGNRIASQIIKDGNSQRNIHYRYVDQSNNSSGTIMNLPKFADIQGVQTVNGNDVYSFMIKLRSSSNIELTDGSFVGYERVIEEEPGKGRTEYIYTSPNQFPNQYPSVNVPAYGNNAGGANPPLTKTIKSSFFPGDVFIENDKTGKLISRKVFDNNSQLLEHKIFNYIDKIFATKNYTTTRQHSRVINTQNGYTYRYDLTFQLENSQNLVSSEESTSYLNGNQLKTKNEYTYGNSSNPFMTLQKGTDSDNSIFETFYRYAADKGNQYLLDKNIISVPLETEVKKDSKTISKNEIKYPVSQSDANLKTSGLAIPYSLISKDLQGVEKTEIIYDRYDNKGNLLQFTTRQLPTTIIWGYNQTLPIAKIVGSSYAQTMQAFNLDPNDSSSYLQLEIVKKSNLDKDDSSETNFVSELENFKNKNELKDFHIYTYVHDPLIGKKVSISEKGMKESYKYDSANRLQTVLDHGNNIIREYTYNYNDLPVIFSNDKRSKTFTRNNCDGAGMVPGTYEYIVPAGQHTSTISKIDAEQKAIDDINANGQNAANTYAVCYYPYCEFNSQSSNSFLMMQYAPFQKANTVVNAQLNFQIISNQGLNWSGGVLVGYIPSPCWPTTTITKASGNWQVTIYQGSGQTVLRWTGSGNPSTGMPYNITFNYNVN